MSYTNPWVLQGLWSIDSLGWVDGQHAVDEVFGLWCHSIPLWGWVLHEGKRNLEVIFVFSWKHRWHSQKSCRKLKNNEDEKREKKKTVSILWACHEETKVWECKRPLENSKGKKKREWMTGKKKFDQVTWKNERQPISSETEMIPQQKKKGWFPVGLMNVLTFSSLVQNNFL